jgi:hypothetical protein
MMNGGEGKHVFGLLNMWLGRHPTQLTMPPPTHVRNSSSLNPAMSSIFERRSLMKEEKEVKKIVNQRIG